MEIEAKRTALLNSGNNPNTLSQTHRLRPRKQDHRHHPDVVFESRDHDDRGEEDCVDGDRRSVVEGGLLGFLHMHEGVVEGHQVSHRANLVKARLLMTNRQMVSLA